MSAKGKALWTRRWFQCGHYIKIAPIGGLQIAGAVLQQYPAYSSMPRQGVASCFSTWPGQLTFYHKDQGSSWPSLVPGRHSGAPVLNKMVSYGGLQIRDEFPQIHGWRIRDTTATTKSNLFPKIQCLLCKPGEVAPLSRIHTWPRLWRSAALALR